MAKNGILTQYDDAGFPASPVFTQSLSVAATVTLKAAAGRLARVVVTASSTGTVTFFDNASTNSGTTLFVVPASAAVGTVYDVNLPAALGITAVSAASPSTVTVAWS